MSGFLLDTNVVSELVRKKPEPKVVQWIQDTDEELLYLSVLTMGEIHKGITSHPDAAQRVRLERWLSRDLKQRFSAEFFRWTRMWLTAGESLSG